MKGAKLLCVLGFVGISQWVSAQTDRGTIEGLIADASGAAVPSARVQVVCIETNITTEVGTNELGRYFAANLPLGTYKVVIEKPGFRTAIREPIIIQAQTRARVDLALEVGAVEASLEVKGEAPLLDSSSTTVSTGINTKFIGELPLISIGSKRNIADYLKYVPGLTLNPVYGVRVNGASPGNNEVFIDGAPSSQGFFRGSVFVTGPALEQVGEFSVVTNSFNAEYGGVGTWFTNITIRSGTNQLHGSAFDYLANNKLNARSFFQNQRAILRQNEGGFVLGGPVYLPKIYDGRNRTFFFVAQDLFWNRTAGAGNLLTIPTMDFRRGDFSNLRDAAGNVIPIFDPATTRSDGQNGSIRDAFPGNVVPMNRTSAISQKIVAVMPSPDLGQVQSQNWFNRTGADPLFNTYITTLKADHSFSSAQKISVVYSYHSQPREVAGSGWGVGSPLEGLQNLTVHSQTGRVSHDYIIRPNLLNHFTFGIDRYYNLSAANTIGQGWDQKLGISGLPWDRGAFPVITFAGGTATPLNMSNSSLAISTDTRVSFNENLAWIRGRHSLKFGISHWRQDLNQFQAANGSGTFAFSNTMTSQPDAGVNFARWGNAFASFLLGEVNQASTLSPTTFGDRFRNWGLFAQDEWRVTARFTLSYGLRWDFIPAAFEVNGLTSSFDPTVPNPGADGRLGALVFAGSGSGRTGRQGFADNWHRGFAPRLGLAYELNRQTVLRASSGIYYAMGQYPILPTSGFSSSPTFTSSNGFSAAYNWANGFPQSFPKPPFISPTFQNGQGISWIARDSARPPQILSWTFGIQRQLAPNLALDVTYIGSHSTHLAAPDTLVQPNVVDARYLPLGALLLQPITSPAAAAAGIVAPFPSFINYPNNTVAQALKPYPQYLGIGQLGQYPVGIARFNSLQVKATKRYSNGLTLLTFWTWQKNMTDVDSGGIVFGPSQGPIQYPFNRAGEVSVSNVGPAHDFTGSADYDLPFGPGKALFRWKGVAGRLIGGWQTVAYFRRASGLPLSVTTGNNLATLGYGSKRANSVAGQPVHLSSPGEFDPSQNLFLNPGAFAIPGSFEFGNTARALDWARGWPQKSESISLAKTTQIKEKITTRLRIEMENPFNFVRWGDPVSDRSNALFGHVITTFPGRTVQLSLAVQF